jgi:hypothetical protein
MIQHVINFVKGEIITCQFEYIKLLYMYAEKVHGFGFVFIAFRALYSWHNS